MLINIGLITEFVALIIRPSLVMLPSERSKDFKYQWCGMARHYIRYCSRRLDSFKWANGKSTEKQRIKSYNCYGEVTSLVTYALLQWSPICCVYMCVFVFSFVHSYTHLDRLFCNLCSRLVFIKTRFESKKKIKK